MLDKWNYSYSQNLSYQQNFASAKTLKQDQDWTFFLQLQISDETNQYTPDKFYNYIRRRK